MDQGAVIAAASRRVDDRFGAAKISYCASIVSRLTVPRDPQWDIPLNSRGELTKHSYDVIHPCTGTLQADARTQGNCPGSRGGSSRKRKVERPSARISLRCESVSPPGLVLPRQISVRSLHGIGASFCLGFPARTCYVVKGADYDCARRHFDQTAMGSRSIRSPGEVARNRCFRRRHTRPMSQAVPLQTVRWALEIMRSVDPPV
jgi:hypothetical protein